MTKLPVVLPAFEGGGTAFWFLVFTNIVSSVSNNKDHNIVGRVVGGSWRESSSVFEALASINTSPCFDTLKQNNMSVPPSVE